MDRDCSCISIEEEHRALQGPLSALIVFQSNVEEAAISDRYVGNWLDGEDERQLLLD